MDVLAHKLGLVLTKVTNYRLEITKKERHKEEKIIARQKTEAMIAKYRRAKREISLSSKKKRNYKNNKEDKSNLNQANNKYLL